MSNLLIGFILASILTTTIAVATMFLVDLLFGQPLYKKLREKYYEFIRRNFYE